MTAIAQKKGATIKGTPRFIDQQKLTDPGNFVNVIDETIALDKKGELHTLYLNSNMYGEFEVFIEGVFAGSGNTGEDADGSNPFSWFPARPFEPGDNILVRHRADDDTPIADVKAHLMIAEESA